MFSSKRIRYCTLKEMQYHLTYCHTHRHIISGEKHPLVPFGNTAYLSNKMRWIELSYRIGDYRCTYKFDKATDSEDDHPMITGLQAYRVLQRYYKVPKVIKSKEDARFSAIPLLWNNPKYENKRISAFCYDMNSAYGYAMLKDIPDTSKPFTTGQIKEGQIGFVFDNEGNVDIAYKGFSMFIFDLIPSPFVKFVNKYYNMKQNAKTKVEKRKAKEYLNFCVGFLQGRNEFLRAFIVCSANNMIKSLIDENTVYCNTDSIVSLVERPDLKLGKEIGQWKLEHKGDFAYRGFNYQWYGEKPSYRGICKNYFPDGWDILKDKFPDTNNLYELDYSTYKLRRTKYEIKS